MRRARRDLLLSLLAAAVPASLRAQATARKRRLGVLYWGQREYASSYFEPHFVSALSELGHSAGSGIEIEWRYSDGDTARDARIAAELGAARLDAIATAGSERTNIVLRETRDLPVIAHVDDPVGRGLARSLSAPGGRVTGITVEVEPTAGKQLEVLRTLMPKVSHVALLIDAITDIPQARAAPVMRAAQRLGLSTEWKVVAGLPGFEEAFNALKPKGERAAYILNIRPTTDAAMLAALAVRHRVATMSLHAPIVEQGGLMAYFVNGAEVARRMAALLDKVLRGTAPAAIPFETPTRFDLVINRKTAREIGIEIPGEVLLRATRVVG